MASHELRTPLTPLSMHLQTLERRLAAGAPAEALLASKARKQLGKLTSLIDDLLDLSRLEAGRLELHLEPLELGALAAAVVEDFRDASPRHKVELRRPAKPLLLRGDRSRLEQVFVNFLQNAIKYSPEGGAIRVEVSASDGDAFVSVSDEGIGVPAEEQPRLFERFFRARNATARNFGGLGIGLHVSNEIVHRHGGEFTVRSAAGRGSTFEFRLPLAPAAKALPGGRILLVDDDPAIRDAAGAALEYEGYSVELARDGEDALDRVRREAPDLVLLDLMMPVCDGRSFVERLRREHLAAGVPIVLLSADSDVALHARRLDLAGALHKPFDLERLH